MSKIQGSIKLLEETFVTMETGSQISNMSQVYFRKRVEKLETDEQKTFKTLIFGRQVIERTVVERLMKIVEKERLERTEAKNQRDQEKLDKKSKKGSEVTLIELKYECKQLGISIGRKNKIELVKALVDYKTEHETVVVEEETV